MRLPDSVRRPRVAGVAVAVLVVVVVAAALGLTRLGGSGDGSDQPAAAGSSSPSPSDTGTPLTEVDTTRVAATREPFCDRIGPAAILRALDLTEAQVDTLAARAWTNGENVRLETGLRDVAHEHGCSWRGEDGVQARSWVFVPPVTRSEARALVTGAEQRQGCSPVTVEAAYGRPSGAADCRQGEGSNQRRERVFAGLFGDAWLTCSLSGPVGVLSQEELVERASTWCAAVVTATGTEESESS